jgi:tetrahydromethanopterin S-methyltransferase subunit G
MMTEIEKSEFSQLKQCVSETAVTIEELNKKTDRIYYALVGNDLTRDGGLVQQIKDMNSRQDEFEKEVTTKLEKYQEQLDSLTKTIGRWKGIAIGMLLCGGVIGYLIQYILDHHFK